jgi:hypothetical protein
MFGEDAHAATKALCDWAAANGYRSTLRTGLHVHVDVRWLTKEQLNRVSPIYALMEKAIYRWVGDDRDENPFCLPWYRSEPLVRTIATILACNEDRLAHHSEQLNRRKYGGLNYDTLHRFGSIEFRHMKVTHDVERIIRWVNICQRIVEAAVRLPYTPAQLIAQMSAQGAIALAKEILQDQYNDLKYEDMDRDMWETGLQVAQDVVMWSTNGNLDNPGFDKGVNVGWGSWADRNLKAKPEVPAPKKGPADMDLEALLAQARRRINPNTVTAPAQRAVYVNEGWFTANLTREIPLDPPDTDNTEF